MNTNSAFHQQSPARQDPMAMLLAYLRAVEQSQLKALRRARAALAQAAGTVTGAILTDRTYDVQRAERRLSLTRWQIELAERA